MLQGLSDRLLVIQISKTIPCFMTASKLFVKMPLISLGLTEPRPTSVVAACLPNFLQSRQPHQEPAVYVRQRIHLADGGGANQL